MASSVAVESLAARAPLPVQLTLQVPGRLPERVEVAAYYVVSESLTNVAKHAQATAATVVARAAARDCSSSRSSTTASAARTPRHGSGLRGLADRVEALGGRLRVWTPRGGGTRVQAEIPCA